MIDSVEELTPPVSFRAGQPRSLLLQAADGKRPYFGDAVKVTVHVNHSETVMQSCLGNEQVRYRSSMPHSMVMGEGLL